MKLVMFLDAIEHVSRISRIVSSPKGNALLLGVGGSGRQSLTRLACYIQDFDVFQIEIAKGYGQLEWRDDLKTALMMAGKDGKETVFLFTDTQSFQQYWHIYDSMSRDGTATEILAALSEAANTSLPCPVPHMEVQGDILEGMVARMVPIFEVEDLVQVAAKAEAGLSLIHI